MCRQFTCKVLKGLYILEWNQWFAPRSYLFIFVMVALDCRFCTILARCWLDVVKGFFLTKERVLLLLFLRMFVGLVMPDIFPSLILVYFGFST